MTSLPPQLRWGIRHGDCREVLSRIPPESVAMIMTSPPYTDLRNYLRIKPPEYVDWFLPVAHQLKRVMTPTGNFFLNINDRCRDGFRLTTSFELVCALIDRVGFRLVETYIWHKPNARPGAYGKRAKDAFEYVFHLAKDRDHYFDLSAIGRPYRNTKRAGCKNSCGPRKVPSGFSVSPTGAYTRGWADPGNVFSISIPSNKTNHTAVMPGRLARQFILVGSRPGEVVLDPFCGSGTTCVEAVRTGRGYLGIELHRQYVELARKRVIKARREVKARRGLNSGTVDFSSSLN